MTLKQWARHEFDEALGLYREALLSGDPRAIVLMSARAWSARTRKTDARVLNAVFKEVAALRK